MFRYVSYIDQNPRVKLKDSPLFYRAKVVNGTVAWPEEIDFDPETLYELPELLEPYSTCNVNISTTV